MKNAVSGPGISPARRYAYYAGLVAVVVGAMLFMSTFVTFIMRFGDFGDFEARTRSEGLRAFGGMVLMMIGGGLMAAGAVGPAASGLLLDPERAARDLEPYARASGKLSDAAFSEMHTVRQTLADLGGGESAREVVRVRCRACQSLNDESNRFCGQCGAVMA